MKALMTVSIESDPSSAARSAMVLQFVADVMLQVNTCLSKVLNDGGKNSGDTKFTLYQLTVSAYSCACSFARVTVATSLRPPGRSAPSDAFYLLSASLL